MKNPNIDTVIPSIVDNEQLEENISAMAAPFSAADGKLLARGWKRSNRTTAGCAVIVKAVLPGLPVADVLRFLMYAEGYGQFAWARAIQSPTRGDCRGPMQFVRQLHRQVPNGVQVPARLHKAQQLFA